MAESIRLFTPTAEQLAPHLRARQQLAAPATQQATPSGFDFSQTVAPFNMPTNILRIRQDPSAQFGLAGFAQGFGNALGGASGLTEALIGGFGGAAGGIAQGQEIERRQANIEQQRADELLAQQARQQLAAQKLAADAARQAEQTRQFEAKQAQQAEQFEAKLPIEQQKAAQGRFKSVGTDLFDVSGAEPKLVARGRRASEPLVPVFDPATGETRFRTRAEAVGGMAPPKTGMEVVTDPTTGQTVVRTGVQAGQGTEIGTKGRNKIEDQMIDLTAARQRLGNIAASWRPEFSELPNQLGMTFQQARDRAGLLPADQKQALADYSQWQQNTRANLNRTIKEITGAAMTIAEAERIRGEVPNLEDGPTVFQAKLQNAMRLTNLAQARLAHLRNQGLPMGGNFGGVDLNEMPEIIDRRGTEIEQQMIAQGMAPEVAEQQAMAQVRQEFGI